MNKNYSAALDEILKLIDRQETKMLLRKHSEINRMFEQLEKDGMMMTTQSGEPIQALTLKGMDWISPEMGGYTQERVDKISERNRLVLFDRRMEKSTCVLAWGTVGVAIGAIALVMWEIYKTFCIEHGCH